MAESIGKYLDQAKRDFGSVFSTFDSTPKRVPDGMLGDPNCPICHGIGFVAEDLPVGDPNFGKMAICACRGFEMDSLRQKKKEVDCNLAGYTNMRFANFDVQGRGQLRQDEVICLKFALEQSQRFAAEPQGWILMIGSYGCGKTHLAAAIANEIAERDESLIFLPVPDLLDWLRSSYGEARGSYQERFEQIRNAPVLILDDLGTQNATPWAEEKLFMILDYRCVHRLPTVITTNNQTKDMDGRIGSRLEVPELVTRIHIQAPDYRKPMADQSGEDSLSTLHLYEKSRFETFQNRLAESLSAEAAAQLSAAYNGAYAYAKQAEGWLVFSGPNGVGKTHLAAAIGNYRTHRMDMVLFKYVPDLLDHLRDAFSPMSATTYSAIFERIRNASLLVLDHLDTTNATPWAKEKLNQLLNHRYQAELPTVITTTLPIQEIDPNIRSRLVDNQICKIYSMFQVPMYGRLHDFGELPPRIKRESRYKKERGS